MECNKQMKTWTLWIKIAQLYINIFLINCAIYLTAFLKSILLRPQVWLIFSILLSFVEGSRFTALTTYVDWEWSINNYHHYFILTSINFSSVEETIIKMIRGILKYAVFFFFFFYISHLLSLITLFFKIIYCIFWNHSIF